MKLGLIVLALCWRNVFSEQLCSKNHGTDLKLSVSSKRNATGHWTVSVEAGREDRRATTILKPSREITVDLGHSTQHCGDEETSQIQATVNLGGLRTPPPGYEILNAIGYYKMHPTALTMDEGREKCAQEGAHIIVLNSDNEADVIRTFLARKPNIPNANAQEYTFVGLHDWNEEGKFITLLGEPVEQSGYNRWRSGEPNGGRTENCVVVNKEVKFVDIDCNWKLFIICELYDL